jgi:hypothetical protein
MEQFCRESEISSIAKIAGAAIVSDGIADINQVKGHLS